MPTLAIYIKKFKIELPYDPQIFTPRYISEKHKFERTYEPHVHSSIIYNRQYKGATCVQQQMNKEDVRYMYICMYVCVYISIHIYKGLPMWC